MSQAPFAGVDLWRANPSPPGTETAPRGAVSFYRTVKPPSSWYYPEIPPTQTPEEPIEHEASSVAESAYGEDRCAGKSEFIGSNDIAKAKRPSARSEKSQLRTGLPLLCHSEKQSLYVIKLSILHLLQTIRSL